MRQLSPAGQQAVNDIVQRHGFSPEAVASMLTSVANGRGGMAQFNHAEFGGGGQWMRGGMTMVSDMFNNQLKGRVDALCNQLAELVASQPDLMQGGSQQQGGNGQWWPDDLGAPNSTGAQNGARYAYFAQARRLAIDIGGKVTVYDTQDHRIGGVSQQQSQGTSLSFTSQHGPIDIDSLPVVSGAPPDSAERDVFAAIEKLAGLHAKGILSEDEFRAKKTELLARL